jgi:uncharacterized SAM-binding protein YcdF (DUF218 family)
MEKLALRKHWIWNILFFLGIVFIFVAIFLCKSLEKIRIGK